MNTEGMMSARIDRTEVARMMSVLQSQGKIQPQSTFQEAWKAFDELCSDKSIITNDNLHRDFKVVFNHWKLVVEDRSDQADVSKDAHDKQGGEKDMSPKETQDKDSGEHDKIKEGLRKLLSGDVEKIPEALDALLGDDETQARRQANVEAAGGVDVVVGWFKDIISDAMEEAQAMMENEQAMMDEAEAVIENEYPFLGM